MFHQNQIRKPSRYSDILSCYMGATDCFTQDHVTKDVSSFNVLRVTRGTHHTNVMLIRSKEIKAYLIFRAYGRCVGGGETQSSH